MYAARAAGKGQRARLRDQMLRRYAVVERTTSSPTCGPPSRATSCSCVGPAVATLPSGQVHGLAGVAVWDSPGRGELPVERWLPVAEQAGLVGEIGARLLAQACAALRTWHERAGAAPAPPAPPAARLGARLAGTAARDSGSSTACRALLHDTGTPRRASSSSCPSRCSSRGAGAPAQRRARAVAGAGDAAALDGVGGPRSVAGHRRPAAARRRHARQLAGARRRTPVTRPSRCSRPSWG